MAIEGKTVLMIIAPRDFRDEEYAQPRSALFASGVKIITASRAAGVCTGMLGSQVTADASLDDVAGKPWDMVVFIGGSGAQEYFDDETCHRIAIDAVEAERPLAAICIAPSILAHAGVLKGVDATAWPDQEGDLKARGAHWTGDAVTVGQSAKGAPIVTANGPRAAFAFGQMLVSVLENA